MKYPLMRQNIQREDLDTVIELLKQDDPKLTAGPRVSEFEEKWSEWLGVKYSIFVNSGSSSNLLAIAWLKLRFGGERSEATLDKDLLWELAREEPPAPKRRDIGLNRTQEKL